MEYIDDGTEYGNIDGLINGISLEQKYVTVIDSSVRVIDSEINISNVELGILDFNCLL